MANHRKRDLHEFETWLSQVYGFAPLTVSTYTGLVRGMINRTNLTEPELLTYVQTLSPHTCSLSKSAWRLFVQFAHTKQYNLPNPFGSGTRVSRTQSNFTQRLEELGVKPTGTPVVVATAIEAPVSEVLAATPEVRDALHNFLSDNPNVRKVLHRFRWDWTVYNEFVKRWQTAFPGEKKETWLYVDRKFLTILGQWGYGEDTPKSGYFIPKAYQSNEPVPEWQLRSMIEVDK